MPTRSVTFPLREPFFFISSYQTDQLHHQPPILKMGPHCALTDAHLRAGGASLAIMDLQLRYFEAGQVRHISTISGGLVIAPDHRTDSMISMLAARLAHDMCDPRAARQDTDSGLLTLLSTIGVAKGSSCVVLGKDTFPDLEELRAVRDDLRYRGLDAVLVKEMPEIAGFSNVDKVRVLCQAATFAVCVDRVAAGQLVEIASLRETSCILAVLRPRGQGSTWMIGPSPDRPNVRYFEFDESPLAILEEVVAWAKSQAAALEKFYDSHYPWRRNKSRFIEGRSLPLLKIVEAAQSPVSPTKDAAGS